MSPDPFDPVTASSPAAADTPEPSPPPARYAGPFEREAWPERLTARVVTPGDGVRIHGYDVAGDLARHHGLAGVLWLALCGELPTEAQRAALEVACVLLAPIHVGQAPAHAALLARVAGGTPGATLAIAAVGLGELFRHERETLAPWLAWLEHGAGEVPQGALAGAATDSAIGLQRWLDAQMRRWFGPGHGLPSVPLTRLACAYALLDRLGLRGPLMAETVAMCARLPTIAAEAAHGKAGQIRDYPTRLPDYQYVDSAGASS